MGNTYFSKAVTEQFDMTELLYESHKGGGNLSMLEQLTVHEREVLQLICEGYTTNRIADEFGISPKTVESS